MFPKPVWSAQYYTASVIFLFLIQYALAQPPYQLDSGDQVRITVHTRPDISGIYTVSASGEISLPLIGRIGVRGKDPAQLEGAVVAALRDLQIAQPYVAAQIDIYRPFYVDGDVVNPGAYPFEPGLTVRQAIALAGGRLSLRNSTRYTPVDLHREEETLEILLDAYLVDVALEARLVSERDLATKISFPERLLDETRADPRAREALATESALFSRRAASIEGRVALLSERIRQFDKEISELQAERKSLKRKQVLTSEMIASFQKLVEKGVAPRMELLQLDINAIEADRDLRQNSVLILEATLGRNEAEQNISNVRTQRAEDIASDLVEVRSRLAQNAIRIIKVTERLALMSGVLPEQQETGGQVQHRIVRRQGMQLIETTATLDTPVFPSDTLTISYPKSSVTASAKARLPKRIDFTDSDDPPIE